MKALFVLLLVSWMAPLRANGDLPGWPAAVTEIRVTSSKDASAQPSLWYAPASREPVPLLIGLHTWSGDYKQTTDTYGAPYADWCIRNGWAFLAPNFRGPNRRPEATGSDLAVQDVIDALGAAQSRARIDPSRVFLVGTSGGGHLALLLAGRHPELWAGVSAWVPITDLAAWHADTKKKGLRYRLDIEASCGGPPGTNARVDREYRHRSPLTHLAGARGRLPIDINAGIRDGHDGSVPIRHSIQAFNLLAKEEDRLSKAATDYLVTEATVPESLAKHYAPRLENARRVLFRRESNGARLTLFEGGHEIITKTALEWIRQVAEEKR